MQVFLLKIGKDSEQISLNGVKEWSIIQKTKQNKKPVSIISFSVQFSSVTQSCPTLYDPMNRSTPGLPVHHQLPEFTHTHIH